MMPETTDARTNPCDPERPVNTRRRRRSGRAANQASPKTRACRADHLWQRAVVSQEWLAKKLARKSASNVNQQSRRLDGKPAINSMPEQMKHFQEEADTTSS